MVLMHDSHTSGVYANDDEPSLLPSSAATQADTVQSASPQPSVPFVLTTIKPPLPHTLVQNWILFSDLHVKSSSIDICEQVLQTVHASAVERNAGIVFLGDFWHVRGALNVDLLNRILAQFSTWTQPVIMIPGNHDQVNTHH
jgi:Calcineurin-like phosphoesterase